MLLSRFKEFKNIRSKSSSLLIQNNSHEKKSVRALITLFLLTPFQPNKKLCIYLKVKQTYKNAK